MHGKEFFAKMFRTYFVLVTLINVVIYISGNIARPEERFGYSVFILPLIYALAGILPQVVMYSKRELSVREVILRKFIQLLLIELMVNGIILGENAIRSEYTPILKMISISVVVVFILANMINWIMDSFFAKELTRELVEFQEKQEI